MNYISLRFISSAVASFPPFMIVFNPHHIFIQNKYPPTHNPPHDTLRSAGRGRRNVSAKVEREGGETWRCASTAGSACSLMISSIRLLANYWLLPVNAASLKRKAMNLPASSIERQQEKRKGTRLLKERQINICSFTCLPLPHTQ